MPRWHSLDGTTQNFRLVGALNNADHENPGGETADVDTRQADEAQQCVHCICAGVIEEQDENQFRHRPDHRGVDFQKIPEDRAAIEFAKGPRNPDHETEREPADGELQRRGKAFQKHAAPAGRRKSEKVQIEKSGINGHWRQATFSKGEGRRRKCAPAEERKAGR
ncbi:hypothetical protein LAX5112_02550 [Roseibium alexandrii]|uniref:Uncharacterized protein n=1 Tax=Roseibium alexandrii TaxID=388408 RepID=A0A0M7A7M5_9HYPH|nr:hypothetical protein LAX5112_02550 [Roseibium alexandrii]